MNTVFSSYTASISELKKNPNLLLEEAKGEPVAILNHNRPTAYLIPASTYEDMLEAMEDARWMRVIEQRKKEKSRAKEVSLDEL